MVLTPSNSTPTPDIQKARLSTSSSGIMRPMLISIAKSIFFWFYNARFLSSISRGVTMDMGLAAIKQDCNMYGQYTNPYMKVYFNP
jgi:hypothetical protein